LDALITNITDFTASILLEKELLTATFCHPVRIFNQLNKCWSLSQRSLQDDKDWVILKSLMNQLDWNYKIALQNNPLLLGGKKSTRKSFLLKHLNDQ